MSFQENEEEMEEEVGEEDSSRGPSRKLGETSYFCPVAYHDYHILKPGDPDIVATYKGLTYYFGSEEDMAKFMANPERYVKGGHQPPLEVSLPVFHFGSNSIRISKLSLLSYGISHLLYE